METSQTKNNSKEILDYESVNKENIKTQIFEIRGYRVMFDKDIANYFGVTTGNLNKAMKRNIKRFPQSFCFQLTDEECSRFQIGILNGPRGSNIKYLPYVYTEQGVAMLTSALHTDRAIEASIQIIEAFVEMTHYLKQNSLLLPIEIWNNSKSSRIHLFFLRGVLLQNRSGALLISSLPRFSAACLLWLRFCRYGRPVVLAGSAGFQKAFVPCRCRPGKQCLCSFLMICLSGHLWHRRGSLLFWQALLLQSQTRRQTFLFL